MLMDLLNILLLNSLDAVCTATVQHSVWPNKFRWHIFFRQGVKQSGKIASMLVLGRSRAFSIS